MEAPPSAALFSKVGAIAIDHEEAQVICITKDILINQLKREAQGIAESFDRLHSDDLNDLSEVLSRPMSLLFTSYRYSLRTDDELRIVCANLMFNAVHSFIGAAALLRQGFYLQSAILVRSLLEQTATVLHLVTTISDLPRFKRGDLKVTAILRGAKRALPPFGGLYGFFSENFVHMSPLHGSPQPLTFYQRHSDELDVTIGFLRTGVWIILVTTELLSIDLSEDRLYWKPRGHGQVAYDLSDETKEWQEKFLSFPMRED